MARVQSAFLIVHGEKSQVFDQLRTVPAQLRTAAKRTWVAGLNQEQLLEVFQAQGFTTLPPAVRKDVAARLAADFMAREAKQTTNPFRARIMERLAVNLALST